MLSPPTPSCGETPQRPGKRSGAVDALCPARPDGHAPEGAVLNAEGPARTLNQRAQWHAQMRKADKPRLSVCASRCLRQLPAPLAAINLQYGLTSHRAEQIKTLETDDPVSGGRLELRAVTGPDYGRIYDHELVEAVQKIAGNGTGDMSPRLHRCCNLRARRRSSPAHPPRSRCACLGRRASCSPPEMIAVTTHPAASPPPRLGSQFSLQLAH